MAVNAYYECTVAGEFFKSTPGGKTLANYTLTFNVPDLGDNKTDTHYMSVIKNKMLNSGLKAKFPGAITFRTYEMVDRVFKGAKSQAAPKPQGGKKVSDMNRSELEAYIAQYCPEIDTKEVYTTVDKMRKAIKAYEADKAEFLAEQEEALEQIQLEQNLKQLNPNLDQDLDQGQDQGQDQDPEQGEAKKEIQL